MSIFKIRLFWAYDGTYDCSFTPYGDCDTGVDSENTIRVPGQGGFSQGGRPGDVFATLKVCIRMMAARLSVEGGPGLTLYHLLFVTGSSRPSVQKRRKNQHSCGCTYYFCYGN